MTLVNIKVSDSTLFKNYYLHENNKSEIRVGFGLRGGFSLSSQPPATNTTTQETSKKQTLSLIYIQIFIYRSTVVNNQLVLYSHHFAFYIVINSSCHQRQKSHFLKISSRSLL